MPEFTGFVLSALLKRNVYGRKCACLKKALARTKQAE